MIQRASRAALPCLFAILLVACTDEDAASVDTAGADASTPDAVADEPDATDVDDGDAVDADAADAGDRDTDGPRDVDLEVLDGGPETPCGPELTCASGEVCVVICLCCGIDTGNPDDLASDYECVAPPRGCDGSTAECVANQEGCYASGDWVCESPCA